MTPKPHNSYLDGILIPSQNLPGNKWKGSNEYFMALANLFPEPEMLQHCFSDKLWYLQCNRVGDIIVYH